MNARQRLLIVPILVVLPLFGGCDDDDVRVYDVPKTRPMAQGQPTMPDGHPPIGDRTSVSPQVPQTGNGINRPMVDDGSLPAAKQQADAELTYTIPDGWHQGPETRMRVATLYFGEAGQQWELSVIPLGGGAGGMLANINRWAGQVGADPWTEAALSNQATQVDIGGVDGTYVEMRGQSQGILGVIAEHDGMNWFFKAWGPLDQIDAAKPGFQAFIDSVRWTDRSEPAGEQTQP